MGLPRARMMLPRRPSHSQRPSRWLAALLVFALLGLQAVGQAHRALHPQLGALTQLHSHAQPSTFGHVDDSAECRLFDQLLLADLAFAAPSAACAPLAAGGEGSSGAAAPACTGRLAYRARAPPPLSA